MDKSGNLFATLVEGGCMKLSGLADSLRQVSWNKQKLSHSDSR